MRLAVERQKAASVAAEGLAAPPPPPPSSSSAASAPKDAKVPDFKVPDMPSFSMPKIEMPKIDVPSPPKFDVPAPPPTKPAASSSPSVVPEFKVPDALPKFDMPKVDVPSFSMPKFDVPDMPTFALPKVDGMPKFDVPAMPKFDMPTAPPAAYNLDVPKFDAPRKSSSPAAAVADENLEPQEVRDVRAADKNAAFKAAKDEAKVGAVLSLPISILLSSAPSFRPVNNARRGAGGMRCRDFRRCKSSD